MAFHDGNQNAFTARNIHWMFQVQNDLVSLGRNNRGGLIKFALY